MFYSVMHVDYSEFSFSQGVSRASLLQLASASLTGNQSVSKVKMFQTPLFTQHLSVLNLIWIL